MDPTQVNHRPCYGAKQPTSRHNVVSEPRPPAPTSQGARAQRSPRTLTINCASDMPPLQLAGAETEQTNKAPSRPCAPTRSVPRQSSISSDAAAPHARRHAVGRTASSQRRF